MKKALGILLLLIVAFDFAGLTVFYKIRQEIIRQGMKEQLKHSIAPERLHKIEVSSERINEIVWENSHEFFYHAQLFDVVRKEYTDKSIILYCLNDIQEEVLYARLDELVKKRSDNTAGGEALKKLIDLFSKVAFGEAPYVAKYYTALAVYSILPEPRHQAPFLSITGPPPQLRS